MSVALPRLHRWMIGAITDPDGVDAGLARAAGRVPGEAPTAIDELLVAGPGVAVRDRLALCAALYRGRVITALADELPAVAATLGGPAFERCAREYLHHTRPSPGAALAAGFAGFVATHVAESPAGVLIADLVRLERAIAEVCAAPEVDPIAPEALAALGPDDWGRARLRASPALRLLACAYPVHHVRAEVLAGSAEPLPPRPRPCWLLLSRRGGRIQKVELHPVQHAVLAALIDGEPLGAALERGLAVAVDARTVLAGAERWFRAWATLGLFCAVDLAG